MISAAQIATHLEAIRLRVAQACEKTGKDPRDITILGASKGQPVTALLGAWQAGLRVFGENRVQEALGKMDELPVGIEWHLIGPLQSNKVKKVVPAFAAVQSIDRLKIARALDKEAARVERPLLGLLEINLAAEESKHGFQPTQVMAVLPELQDLEALNIVGLMAIPPFEPDPQDSRRWFRQLRELRDTLFSSEPWSQKPGYLSMGMSHDYDVAVEEGATHIRVGTALFGPRGG